MTLDAGAVSAAVVALGLVVAALTVWVAMLQRSERSLRRRLRRILADGRDDGIDLVLDRTSTQIEGLTQRVEALNALHRELSILAERSIQKIGVVRFNPFTETGGDQSFAIALLDAAGSGVVLSSLHSRTETRIFAKQVQGGRSSHPLSEEEQEAIRLALKQAQ